MRAVAYSLPFWILTAGVLGLLGLWSLKEAPPSSPQEDQAPLVEVAEVLPCVDGFTLEVNGVVVPFREVNLAARVSGQIVSKSPQARAGEYVKEGESLFEIDPSDYEIEVRRLRETVKQAGSSIEELDVEKENVKGLVALAEESLELQRKEVARFDQLRARNATPASRVEDAREAELQSMNALQTLRNQMTLIGTRRNRLEQERERANTLLDQALLNLSRTEISAPSNGIIMEDLAERDDYVQVGTPLVRIEDTSKVQIRFNMRMDQLRWLWSHSDVSAQTGAQESYRLPKLVVNVKVDIDGNHFYWPARLDRYDGAGVNASTRTVPVIAIVENPRDVRNAGKDADALPLPGPPTLMRNTFVTVEIPIRNHIDLVSVPTVALRPGENIWAMKDDKLHIQKIKVAHSTKDTSILLVDPTSLAAGDRVVTSPLPLVVEGMDLRLDRPESAATATKQAAVATTESDEEASF